MASPRASTAAVNNDNDVSSPSKSVDNTAEELTVFVQDMLDRMVCPLLLLCSRSFERRESYDDRKMPG
jgi:hypothetical protein